MRIPPAPVAKSAFHPWTHTNGEPGQCRRSPSRAEPTVSGAFPQFLDSAGSVPTDTLSALGVTVTLRGVIPPGAQTFRWQYDLTFASYALTVKSASRADETMWLEGGQESRPVALARVEPPSHAAVAGRYFGLGFTHILPKGWITSCSCSASSCSAGVSGPSSGRSARSRWHTRSRSV